VAIKVLRPELAAALGAERFLREIEIAARLTHPHILALHDSGEANGFLYYVMPYLEGESLRDRLKREAQLPVEEAVRIAREVASALSYAHSQDVVHRDIKPENVLLSGGEAVVADFGIARALAAAGAEKLTDTGLAVGTPGYMSPEQATAEQHIDGRADIYALGCVLYEMLAGHPPFLGTTAQEVLARHTLDPVPPLRTIRPELPPALERAVLKALAKSPADRFPSAAAFSEALTQASAPPSFARQAARPAVFVAAGVAALVAGYVLLTRRPGSSGGAGQSIAVLPFKNIGGDANNEPYSYGMSDEPFSSSSTGNGS
jgi:serine/threonine protein kinase